MFVRIIFAVFASSVITFGFFYGMHTLIQLQLRDVKSHSEPDIIRCWNPSDFTDRMDE